MIVWVVQEYHPGEHEDVLGVFRTLTEATDWINSQDEPSFYRDPEVHKIKEV